MKVSVYLFFCLAFLMAAYCMTPTHATAAQTTKAIGTVVNLDGTAYAVNGAERRSLKEEASIYEKDVLNTGSASAMIVKFIDDTELSMGENTSISMEQYSFDEEPDGIVGFASRLFKGFVKMVTGKIVEREPDSFNLKTPIATVGIRGTEFFAETLPEGEQIGVTSLGKGHVVELTSERDATTIKEEGYYVKVGPDGRFSPLMRLTQSVSSRIMRMQSTFSRMKTRVKPPAPKPKIKHHY